MGFVDDGGQGLEEGEYGGQQQLGVGGLLGF